jgi:protein SCO1/2
VEARASVPAVDARAHRLVWLVFAVALLLVLAAAAWRLRLGSGRDTELPVYGSVPPFAFVERSGRPVAAADLTGHIWIADFIFTRCGGMCPALTTTLAALLRRMPVSTTDGVLAVTFTVDPTRDDPETLRRYADRFGADPVRWLFLTGQQDAVERLVRDGFRLSIAELPPDERDTSPEPITHSDRFVLVDRALRIRGYYHGTDPDDVARLEHDVTRLVAAGA